MKIIEGNLLDCNETYLCHQCNCITKRSAFLANDIFKRFTYADVYSERKTPSIPGTIALRGSESVRDRFVVAMFAQYYPGKSKYPLSKKDGIKARLQYFHSCLKKMEKLNGTFAFPWYIGCGSAGGNWADYYNLLEKFAKQKEVIIYKLPEVKTTQQELF